MSIHFMGSGISVKKDFQGTTPTRHSGFNPGFNQSSSVLAFPKSTPRFSAHTPFFKEMALKAQQQKLDIFSPIDNKKSARIVLLPTETDFSALPDVKQVNLEDLPHVWKGVQQLFKAILSGKSKDEIGNILAVFKGPGGEKNQESRKAKAQTLKAMSDILEKKMAELPDSVEKLTVVLPDKLPAGLSVDRVLKSVAEKSILNAYNPYTFREENHPSNLKEVTFVRAGKASTEDVEASLREGRILGNAQNLARYLVDGPANIKTTFWVGENAKSVASDTLKVNVHEKKWIESDNGRRMGLFLSVAQGNEKDSFEKQPRMVEMIYTPKDGKYDRTLLLAGKGIIFDTGGNNLKTSEFIHNMHGDMAGAAAVIGTMKALDELQVPNVRVIGLAPLTENRLGSGATLPHDIYTARNGKKVAIDNTDAEGRLVLADAIDYGLETYKPDLF
ncbi:MAG: hypothetical protein K2X66_07405, partial [Cyanobacteria bacterium]|nr:hypothetical protein [Cyanobacteriota bacterium]